MRTILTTVGTSLLSNARRDLKTENPDRHQLANYLRLSDPTKTAAETNSLCRLLKEGDDVVFLYSHTEEGELCAKVLEGYFRNKGYDGRSVEVPDLTYSESRFKMRGLRSLVATLIEEVRREQSKQRQVLINATGGFKAEIAYATLVGLLFDIPVYYIHEAFGDIIEMPPTPISWDYTLIADYDEFFEWIDTEPRPSKEVDLRLKALPREISMLLVEEEGYTFLSPAGEAFYEAYREKETRAEKVPILLSAKAKGVYMKSEPNIRHLFRRAIRKIRVKELRQSGSDQVGNSDCLVFPKGHRDERVFYFEDGDRIMICEFTRKADNSYEKAISAGVFRDKYGNFEKWIE
ncbi:MAG: putative CRISPR-associated protein [Thermoproteota archaeon]